MIVDVHSGILNLKIVLTGRSADLRLRGFSLPLQFYRFEYFAFFFLSVFLLVIDLIIPLPLFPSSSSHFKAKQKNHACVFWNILYLAWLPLVPLVNKLKLPDRHSCKQSNIHETNRNRETLFCLGRGMWLRMGQLPSRHVRLLSLQNVYRQAANIHAVNPLFRCLKSHFLVLLFWRLIFLKKRRKELWQFMKYVSWLMRKVEGVVGLDRYHRMAGSDDHCTYHDLTVNSN